MPRRRPAGGGGGGATRQALLLALLASSCCSRIQGFVLPFTSRTSSERALQSSAVVLPQVGVCVSVWVCMGVSFARTWMDENILY